MAIVKKEIIQLKRDPISSRIPVVMPIMMMLIFGYAVNTEVDHIKTAVIDQSQTRESRTYIDKFRNSKYFEITHYLNNQDDVEKMLDSSEIKAAIIIPTNFARDIKNGKNPSVLLEIDGSDSTVARTVLSSAMLVAQNDAIEKMQHRMSIAGLSSINMSNLGINTQVRYNPNMEITMFTIPGLVGIIMMNVTIMLTAFAMVRERERGTIEQLIVTPVHSNELILGKLTPYVFTGYFGFLLALSLCMFYFKIPIVGSLGLLLLLAALFVICCLSIGMLISTFVKNQMQAMFMVMACILPSVMLSGFMFPIEAMPLFLQLFSNLIPATYFLKIVRGIVLKGVGIDVLWPNVVSLCVFMIFTLGIAITRFKKTLE